MIKKHIAGFFILSAMLVTLICPSESLAAKQVKKIKLNKTSITLTKGKTFKLKATVLPKKAANRKIKFKSRNKAIATVNNKGKITARKAGSTSVTASTPNGKKATCKVKVKNPTVTKVTLSSTSLNLTPGSTAQLKATVKPSNAIRKTVTFQSSNPGVASVTTKGKVTALALGNTTITASTKNGKKATCNITVSAAPTVIPSTVPVASITCTDTEKTLTIGASYALNATCTPSNATDKTITYVTDNPAVAIVNTSGIVTTLSAGNATIIATASNGVATSVRITVKENYKENKISSAITSLSSRPSLYEDNKETTLDDVNGPVKYGANVHDPEIIKDGKYYYVFSTDIRNFYSWTKIPQPGIQIRRSTNLETWEYVGTVFNGTKESNNYPDAVTLSYDDAGNVNGVQYPVSSGKLSGAGFWAPCVIDMGDEYYLYYSLSTTGRDSYIGLAKSTRLDGGWKDCGIVLKTTDIYHAGETTVNAIDPAVVRDELTGTLYMAYGSWWSGIYIVELGEDGFIAKDCTMTTEKTGAVNYGVKIAGRTGGAPGGNYVNGGLGIEASSIIYSEETDYYYLAVSYDNLLSNYNVRIGRSHSITGPYLDYNGNDLAAASNDITIGNKLIASYQFNNDTYKGWYGTAHSSFFKDTDGNYYILHNARLGAQYHWTYLHVRELLFTDDDWPVASPEPYTRIAKYTPQKTDLTGTWQIFSIKPTTAKPSETNANAAVLEQETPDSYQFLADGTVKDHPEIKWSYNKKNLTLTYEDGTTVTAKVTPAWDHEEWCETIVFTGLDSNGLSVWGKMSK